jgi:predicted NUDIX family NTP pyrophosphohydrolase
MQEVSAGILIYRKNEKNELEVLLGKNGGPAWEKRNSGAWNIPKGHAEVGENLLDCAIREFEEETSLKIPKNRLTDITYIGEAKTSKNKKVVHIFALEYDYTPGKYKVDIISNLCETEYPKGSGNIILVPELSEAYYWKIEQARKMIFPYQEIFLTRLFELNK